MIVAEPDAGPGKPDDQEPQPQPEAAEASEDADEPDKRLEDLDPEDEEAAGVQGGKRYGRHPGGRL